MSGGMLQTGTILLVSSQTSHRSGLRKTLADLGADNAKIEVAANYTQAKERLAKESPINIIITDDEIDKKFTGLDLIELHRQNNPSSKDRIFFLMTQESSPFLLADFTLRGGDIVISKPFTNETFKKTMLSTVTAKENITDDESTGLAILDALHNNDLEKASELVGSFSSPDSASAKYSMALIYEANKEIEQAYETLVELMEDRVDFRSLVSMIKIGVSFQKHFELLGYVETWLKNFPIHHASIPDMTRVIIVNQKFEVLNEIFDLFSKHKINDNFAKIPLAAGFVMAATHHLESGNNEKAIVYANLGIEYSCNKLSILLNAFRILLKASNFEETEKAYLKLAVDRNTPEEKVNDLLLKDVIYPPQVVLKEGMVLLTQKVIHPQLFELIIKIMRKLNKDPADIVAQANRAFPNMKF